MEWRRASRTWKGRAVVVGAMLRSARLVAGALGVCALALLGSGLAVAGVSGIGRPGGRGLALLAGRDRLTVSRFRLAGPPVALTVAGGSVWVVEETAGMQAVLVRIDPRTGRSAGRFEIGRTGPDFGGATSRGSVVWASAGTHVIRVDARRPAAVRRAALPGEAAAVAVADGSVWVTTVGGRGDAVSRLDAGTLAGRHRLALGFQPVALGAGLGSVWLASPSGLWRIDPATDRLLPAASPVAQPVALTAAAGVWVAGQDGHVSAVGATGGLRRRLALPFSPDAVAATPNRLWVTSNCGCRTGKLALLDSRSGRLLAELPIGETPVALAPDRSGVWVATFADERISHVRPA